MTPTSIRGKTGGLRGPLLHACLFLAVTAAVFGGMVAIDRQERITALECADCSHGTGSPDHTDGRFHRFLRLLHPGERPGDDMAAILRE